VRWFWSRYKSGILTAVLPLVLVLIILKLIDLIWGGAQYFNQKTLDSEAGKWIFLALILLLPLFAGMLLSWKGFRDLALLLCGKIPIVSLFANYIFNKEDADQMAEGKFPEIIFKYAGDAWAFGQVMNKKMLPESPHDPSSKPVLWLIVVGPATTPLSVTGQLVMIKDSDVVYTGRFIKDTVLTVASLGLKCQLDPRKFSKKEPLS